MTAPSSSPSRRVDVGRLRTLAEKAAPYERVETYNRKLWNCRQADLGVALTAAEVLALLDELEVARAVVAEARRSFRANATGHELWSALLAYDRAIAGDTP